MGEGKMLPPKLLSPMVGRRAGLNIKREGGREKEREMSLSFTGCNT
jgi:hypothetical protein